MDEYNKRLINEMIRIIKEHVPKDMKEETLTELLNFVSILIYVQQSIPQKTVDLGKDFLKCARMDLRACRTLNYDKSYALSVYHLQQAVEKTVKGFGLLFRIFSEEDLIDRKSALRSHDSPLTFAELIELLEPILNSFSAINPSISRTMNTSNLREVVKNKEKRLKIAKINSIEIRETFKIIKDSESKINIKELTEKSDSILKAVHEETQKSTVFTEEEKKDITKFKPQNFLGFITTISGLYMLACITFPHEVYTRYPDRKDEMTPMDYEKNTGIVETSIEIATKLSSIIGKLEGL